VLAQYGERYFLVRRLAAGETAGEAADEVVGDRAAAASGGAAVEPRPAATGLAFGPPCGWSDAARHPLVLLTPEMHNRVIVEQALRSAGARVVPALETDSVLALLQAVQDDGAGDLAAVLPGALVSALRSQPGLRAQALIDPVVETPIGWMTAGSTPPTRALDAALALAREPEWMAHVRLHTGTLTLT
jgi:hypothetical protein